MNNRIKLFIFQWLVSAKLFLNRCCFIILLFFMTFVIIQIQITYPIIIQLLLSLFQASYELIIQLFFYVWAVIYENYIILYNLIHKFNDTYKILEELFMIKKVKPEMIEPLIVKPSGKDEAYRNFCELIKKEIEREKLAKMRQEVNFIVQTYLSRLAEAAANLPERPPEVVQQSTSSLEYFVRFISMLSAALVLKGDMLFSLPFILDEIGVIPYIGVRNFIYNPTLGFGLTIQIPVTPGFYQHKTPGLFISLTPYVGDTPLTKPVEFEMPRFGDQKISLKINDVIFDWDPVKQTYVRRGHNDKTDYLIDTLNLLHRKLKTK